ncbi:hypothetical protein PtB15_10B211 [Puccinia triticina]|nr:hypothetical protein PtB15_10B211 [Puccinia triticina]
MEAEESPVHSPAHHTSPPAEHTSTPSAPKIKNALQQERSGDTRNPPAEIYGALDPAGRQHTLPERTEEGSQIPASLR